jgi:prepilin-type N-terminal cleavage/methylation domain-containing protein
MTRGYSLPELAVTLALIGALMAAALPRMARFRDRIAVDSAAREVTTILSVGRHAAVLQSTRARAVLRPDSLRVERWTGETWERLLERVGPVSEGVTMEVSNPTVVFGPTGMGWGAANTRVTLRRGSQVETITVSRLGRVKRW